MALQMVVDTLDGMDEGIAKLYVERDGKFHLDVDGHDKNDNPDNRIPNGIGGQTLNCELEALIHNSRFDPVPGSMKTASMAFRTAASSWMIRAGWATSGRSSLTGTSTS